MTRQEKNEHILAELERLYPDARPALHFDNPYQLLVAVMLSAQCTDVKVNKVTPALFERFPDAASLAAVESSEVEPYIQSCGIYRNKARNLVLTARALCERFGGYMARPVIVTMTTPKGDSPALMKRAESLGVTIIDRNDIEAGRLLDMLRELVKNG